MWTWYSPGTICAGRLTSATLLAIADRGAGEAQGFDSVSGCVSAVSTYSLRAELTRTFVTLFGAGARFRPITFSWRDKPGIAPDLSVSLGLSHSGRASLILTP